MNKLLLAFFLFFKLSIANSMTILPMGVEQIIDQTTLSVEGIVEEVSTQKNSKDFVTTVKLTPIVSIGEIEIGEKKTVILKYNTSIDPYTDDWVYTIYPRFKTGDRVLVFLNEHSNGEYYLDFHGHAKYDFILKGNKKHFVSSLFPYHPILGRFSYKELFEKIEKQRGSKLVLHEAKAQKKLRYARKFRTLDRDARSPASIRGVDDDSGAFASQNTQVSIGWLLLILMLVCVISRVVLNKFQ